MQTIKPGHYKHFKGFDCVVVGVAKHTETGEEFVMYHHDGEWWVRPAAMFLETVERDGQFVARFTYIGP